MYWDIFLQDKTLYAFMREGEGEEGEEESLK